MKLLLLSLKLLSSSEQFVDFVSSIWVLSPFTWLLSWIPLELSPSLPPSTLAPAKSRRRRKRRIVFLRLEMRRWGQKPNKVVESIVIDLQRCWPITNVIYARMRKSCKNWILFARASKIQYLFSEAVPGSATLTSPWWYPVCWDQLAAGGVFRLLRWEGDLCWTKILKE